MPWRPTNIHVTPDFKVIYLLLGRGVEEDNDGFNDGDDGGSV